MVLLVQVTRRILDFIVSTGWIMYCDQNILCAPLYLPEETQSKSSDLKRFKKDRILRGSSLRASSKLVWCRPKLLALVTVITSKFISRCLGVLSSSPQNQKNVSSTIPSLCMGPLRVQCPIWNTVSNMWLFSKMIL